MKTVDADNIAFDHEQNWVLHLFERLSGVVVLEEDRTEQVRGRWFESGAFFAAAPRRNSFARVWDALPPRSSRLVQSHCWER
jgi:hypothetical protein